MTVHARTGEQTVLNISRDEERVRLALRKELDPETLLEVLDETIEVLDDAGDEYLLMGGIGSSCLRRERWTHDIDLFARPTEASHALEALAAAGFETDETFPDWLFHGHAHNGFPSGITPGGTPVRNVALPVIERSYQGFSVDDRRLCDR